MGNCLCSFNYFLQSDMKKTKPIKVNICWEVNNERKCETLSKNDAFATKKYCEENDGVVFWFQPLED